MPITSASPSPAHPGQPLVVTGIGLLGTTAVVFQTQGGSRRVPVTSASDTSVVVTVPIAARTGLFYLITPGGNVPGPVLSVANPLNPTGNPPPPVDPAGAGAQAAAAYNAANEAARQAAAAAFRQAGGQRGGAAAQAAASAAAQAAAQQAAAAAGDPSQAGAAARDGARDATAPPQNWFKRMAGSPYGQALLGPLQRFIGPGAALGAIASVRSSRNSGGQIASDMVRGALSVPRAALEAGIKIGTALLDGVLSLFGSSGSAVSRMAGQMGSVLLKTFDAGTKILAGGAKLVGGAVGGAAGLAFGVGGAAIGALFGPPGLLVGAAIGAGIAAGILKAVSGLVGAISGILEGVSKAFGESVEVVIGVIKSIGDILKDTVDAAMAKARGILQLSQQTGLSLGDASRASQLGMGFGISGGALNQQNAFIAGSMGALYGGSGRGDAADLRAYRQMYRGLADEGPVGLMIAQTYEGATGKRGYREAVGYSDEGFERQMSRASKLEMAPESVVKFGQEFKSIFDTAAMLAENIKVKIAEAFAPLLQKGLDAAIGYWEENQDKIVATIFKIGKWFYAEFPSLLLGGFSFVVMGVAGFLKFMGEMAHSFAGLLKGFSQGSGGFLESVVGFLGTIDYLTVGWRGFVTFFAVVGGLLYNVGAIVANVLIGIVKAIGWFGEKLGEWSAWFYRHIRGDEAAAQRSEARWQGATDVKNLGFVSLMNRDNLDAVINAAAPTTDIRSAIDNLRNSGQSNRAADAVEGAAKSLDGATKKVQEFNDGTLANWKSKVGNADERGKDYDEQTGYLKRLADSNDKIAQNTVKDGPGGDPRVAIGNFLALMTTFVTEDAYYGTSR